MTLGAVVILCRTHTMRLDQRWDRLLERTPDRTLLITASGARWSVRKLDDLSRNWSDRLADVEEIQCRLVGMHLPNGPDWIAAFIAILRAGGIAMSLDPAEADTPTEAFVASLGATALVDSQGLRSWSTQRRKLPDEICLVKLTSGSTGKPGRFCFTHAQMDADGRQIESGMGLRPDDINFAVIPFGHSYGLGNFLMPMLRSGTAVALGNSILPRELLADLAATSATVFPAVPAIIHALTIADLPDARLAAIRLVISAGGRLPGETARRFRERFNLAVRGFYGSTETGGISFDSDGEDTSAERSVGKPLPGVKVERSRTGRLLVTSPAAYTHGNRRQSGFESGQVLLADVGQVREDGSITLVGRRRGFVKRAGRRIGLAEVEALARAIPGVRETWATVIRIEGSSEAIGLAIETDCGVAEMRAQIRAQLPKLQRPAKVVCLRAFPATPRGKIATVELKKLFT